MKNSLRHGPKIIRGMVKKLVTAVKKILAVVKIFRRGMIEN